MSLHDHLEYVQQHGRTHASTPYNYTDLQADITAMRDVLFADFVDISFIQNLASARRVLTPTTSLPKPTASTLIPPNDLKLAEGLIRAEVGLVFDEEGAAAQDVGHLNAWGAAQYFAEQRKFQFSQTDAKIQ